MGGSRRYRESTLTRAEVRAPVGGLFVRDFRRLEDDQEENAARERNRALDLVPAFFCAVHLICGVAILIDLAGRGAVSPVVAAPLGIVAAIDLFLLFWFRRRPISSLTPHVAVQGAALYTLVVGALWAVAAAASPIGAGDALLPEIAFAGGMLAIPIARNAGPAAPSRARTNPHPGAEPSGNTKC